jgi:hypothetical protein
MKTKQTEQSVVLAEFHRLWSRVSELAEKIEHIEADGSQALKLCQDAHEKVTTALAAVKPIKGQPHGASIEVDMQTKRQLAAEAQALGLRSADELAQIVFHAFIDMCEEDNGITIPLMLQQVPTA